MQKHGLASTRAVAAHSGRRGWRLETASRMIFAGFAACYDEYSRIPLPVIRLARHRKGCHFEQQNNTYHNNGTNKQRYMASSFITFIAFSPFKPFPSGFSAPPTPPSPVKSGAQSPPLLLTAPPRRASRRPARYSAPAAACRRRSCCLLLAALCSSWPSSLACQSWCCRPASLP